MLIPIAHAVAAYCIATRMGRSGAVGRASGDGRDAGVQPGDRGGRGSIW